MENGFQPERVLLMGDGPTRLPETAKLRMSAPEKIPHRSIAPKDRRPGIPARRDS